MRSLLRAIASNASGSATSSSISATTAAAAPSVPTGLAAGTLLAITTSSIAITWSAAAIDGAHDAAASYTVQYRVTSVGGAWTQVSGIGGRHHDHDHGPGAGHAVQFPGCGGERGRREQLLGDGERETYATSLTLNYVSPAGPYAPGYGPGVNVTATPTPASVREAFGASATVEPTSGWINASNYSGNLWGGYPTWWTARPI